MSTAVNEGITPYIIQEGVYGASFQKDNEVLFVRMEKITEENTGAWEKYKEATNLIANSSRGILSTLVILAGRASCPTWDQIRDHTGFTAEEHKSAIEKAIALKENTDGKITTVLKSTLTGMKFMTTAFKPGETRYIVYVTKNRDFSILKAGQDIKLDALTLKNYITAYQDILISVGTDFSAEDHFHNRGISRNPYWVFEGKYSGLSMLLHGFIGVVAHHFFSAKKMMLVMPIGSMRVILQKYLERGEGYFEEIEKSVDIKDLTVSVEDSDVGDNKHWIKVSALVRIFNQAVGCAR